MLSLQRFSALACAALALPACGNSVQQGTSGSGGSTSTQTTSGTTTGTGTAVHIPKSHRATAETCSPDRPPGSIDSGGPAGDCKADAECTKGDTGRCVNDFAKPPFCSYDACQKDDDCGGGSVCDCRNPSQHNANVCIHGNCRVDADCGQDGYCSPSAVVVDPFCTTGIPIGSIGYFCHTAQDECTDDADCGSNDFPACFFNVGKLHFACFQLQCVN